MNERISNEQVTSDKAVLCERAPCFDNSVAVYSDDVETTSFQKARTETSPTPLECKFQRPEQPTGDPVFWYDYAALRTM